MSRDGNSFNAAEPTKSFSIPMMVGCGNCPTVKRGNTEVVECNGSCLEDSAQDLVAGDVLPTSRTFTCLA